MGRVFYSGRGERPCDVEKKATWMFALMTTQWNKLLLLDRSPSRQTQLRFKINLQQNVEKSENVINTIIPAIVIQNWKRVFLFITIQHIMLVSFFFFSQMQFVLFIWVVCVCVCLNRLVHCCLCSAFKLILLCTATRRTAEPLGKEQPPSQAFHPMWRREDSIALTLHLSDTLIYWPSELTEVAGHSHNKESGSCWGSVTYPQYCTSAR